MIDDADLQPLTELLANARGTYPFGLRFHLSVEVVVAFTRGLLSVRPNATPAELVW